MKRLRTILLIGCFVFLGACLTPSVKAGEWSQKTVVTFGHPVELPGIVLPEGTYAFRLVDNPIDRNYVQVLSQNQQKVVAIVRAIPDYRIDNVNRTEFVFEERMAGAPHAIKKWFFSGRRYGHKFVYPEMGTLELGESEDPESANNLVESAGLQFNEAPSTKNGPDATHSGQMMQSKETDYLRLLHEKQTGALDFKKADESANKPIESPGLSYLEVLYQKQTAR
jgi:hypothetical protein